jgi:hypothetical protein
VAVHADAAERRAGPRDHDRDRELHLAIELRIIRTSNFEPGSMEDAPWI